MKLVVDCLFVCCAQDALVGIYTLLIACSSVSFCVAFKPLRFCLGIRDLQVSRLNEISIASVLYVLPGLCVFIWSVFRHYSDR